MAIDVVLTKHIQNSIREAIRNERIPHDLANQLSEYTEKCLGKKESDSVEDKVAIPFKLLKRLWECLRETEKGMVKLKPSWGRYINYTSTSVKLIKQ